MPISIQRRNFLASVMISLCGHEPVLALGVGELQLSSTLGQPLLAHMQLSETGDLNEREIKINLAPATVYQRMDVTPDSATNNLRFSLDEKMTVTVTSGSPIKEPYLNFVVQLRWPDGELVREYKLFLDPPSQ